MFRVPWSNTFLECVGGISINRNSIMIIIPSVVTAAVILLQTVSYSDRINGTFCVMIIPTINIENNPDREWSDFSLEVINTF